MTEAQPLLPPETPEHLRLAVAEQTKALQETLEETRALATEQDAGVTVHYRPMDSAGQMQVEMFIDSELKPGQVKYVQLGDAPKL